MSKYFDKKVTGEEYLKECERAARGEIHIEQMIVLRNCGYHWRILGREFSPEEQKKPVKSAFTHEQSVFKYERRPTEQPRPGKGNEGTPTPPDNGGKRKPS